MKLKPGDVVAFNSGSLFLILPDNKILRLSAAKDFTKYEYSLFQLDSFKDKECIFNIQDVLRRAYEECE